jgi:hypothetical protein
MIKSMYIGSGDVHALLMGKDTAGHLALLQKFVSNEKPNYNAEASPIDALRIGKILEENYYKTIPDYYPQTVVVCDGIDNVFRASIDFAKIQKGKIVDFDELKTVNFVDFLEIKQSAEYVKKHYKANYNQVQHQLLCTGLHSCNIVFLVVYSYDDTENRNREIKPNEFIKIRIFRDEKVINEIKERGSIFQQIKDFYK